MSAAAARRFVVTALLAVPAARALAEDDAVVRTARSHVKAYQDARKAGRTAAALDEILQAYALRPHHAGIAFELSAAYAAASRVEEAAQMLRLVAEMGLPLKTEGREEFAACRQSPECGATLAAVGRGAAPRATSTVAFSFPGPGLIPEGLAHDAASDAFFVSSVRQRRVLRLGRDRRVHPFADRGVGLWAALGMAVDAARGRLWVATAALPEMEGATAADEGRSALLALDLRTGAATERHEVAPDGRPHVLGDVIVAPSGEVFATDSASPAVYRVAAGGKALEPIAAGEPFVSPQGLALSADGTRLFVADYAKGVFAIALPSHRVRLLEAPRNAALLGIDGVYLAGETLLAVQNGVEPARLLRLSIEGDGIAAVEVLDSAHPAFADPTLGVVTGGRFYYIANSQWAAARPGGQMDPAVKPQDPIVLVVDLRSPAGPSGP